MKRFVTKLLLFVLVGAIINVAVAWWCSLRSSTSGFAEVEYVQRAPERLAPLVPKEWLVVTPHVTFIMKSLAEQRGFGYTIIQFGMMDAIPGAFSLGPSRTPCRTSRVAVSSVDVSWPYKLERGRKSPITGEVCLDVWS